jgi:hypothetical protein
MKPKEIDSGEGSGNGLIESVPLTGTEKALYWFRLVLLLFTSPVLWYEYRRAQRRTGYSNPHAFVKAIRLRLGRKAREVNLDALNPKPVAKVIRRLRIKRGN